MNKPLIFDIALGRTKPVNIRNEEIRCPFCDTKSLTNIIETKDNIIWLMNKYPVLQQTWPTVIIETDDDQGEFSAYPLEHATEVLAFAMEKWEETMKRKEFKSVLLFKNHGPMSGGSIRHPHSQIIGLEDYDYREDVRPKHFTGWLLHEDNDISITLSSTPLIGFFEYNLKFKPTVNMSCLAKRLQNVLTYLLQTMAKHSNSYNYFFYDIQDGYYYIKVVARYVTTPLFIGYKIAQTCDDNRAELIRHKLMPYLR